MKKNVMLKIASVLMVAVLLTTCAISSTFAKYTSTTSDSAMARVAKWGVTANMTIDGLFATSYTSASGKVAASNGTDYVIAPGTYDEITFETQISGTPEVSVAVDYTADVTLVGFDAYCPLVFYVNDTKVVTDGSAADLVAKLEAEINKLDVTADPNTDLNTLSDIKIEWEWVFGDGSTDDKDTALGDAAADALNDSDPLTVPPSITIEIGVVINQTGPAAVKA